MNENTSKITLIVSIILLTFGILYAGVQVNHGLENFQSYNRYVTMKGLAQKDVKADLSLWNIAYTETGNDLEDLQTMMDSHGQKIITFLKGNGIEDDEIELKNVRVQDLLAQSYRQNNSLANRYILTQSYLVRSKNIDAVSKAGKKMGELIKSGIVFAQNTSTSPTYLYTKLNDIKPEMIAEATRNAREAAKEFAENSGQKVGGVKTASQGVFQILPRDQSYAIPESQQRDKTVRVVSTIRFFLED